MAILRSADRLGSRSVSIVISGAPMIIPTAKAVVNSPAWATITCRSPAIAGSRPATTNSVVPILEAVDTMPAYKQPLRIVRPGGVISRVGVPQYEAAPIGMGSLFRHNLRLAGGPAPVVRDLVASWNKVMNLERFDLA